MNIVSTRELGIRTIATDADGIEYSTKYSIHQGAYYIARSGDGEPVSGLYDTREQAEADMVAGTF